MSKAAKEARLKEELKAELSVEFNARFDERLSQEVQRIRLELQQAGAPLPQPPVPDVQLEVSPTGHPSSCASTGAVASERIVPSPVDHMSEVIPSVP